METKRCLTCQGSGKIMGGGMLYKSCTDCEGHGKLYNEKSVHDELKKITKDDKHEPSKKHRKNS